MAEQVITKKCCICKTIKHISDFNKNRCRYDGLQTFCKSCNRAIQRKHKKTKSYAEWLSKYKSTDKYKEIMKKSLRKYKKSEKGANKRRAFQGSPEQKTKSKIRQKKWRNNNPQKAAAHYAARKSIRYGYIKRPSELKCVYCNMPAEQYHHHLGYAKKHWLDIQPVCKLCHYKIHDKLNLSILPKQSHFYR